MQVPLADLSRPTDHGVMSFVAINVLTVPEGGAATLEERFARRAGTVERAEGFEHFEVLRPISGTDHYLVYTRWRSHEDFTAWTQSQAFHGGHGAASGRTAQEARAATGSTIWSFDVVSSAGPA
jgi:heme-degrading monooxygenase HmoA